MVTNSKTNIKNPDLSIIIPFYNECDNVINVITKISEGLNNSGISYELILVDNGSTDLTRQHILDLAKFGSNYIPVLVDFNQGYGFGIRQVLSFAKGRIVGWTDGDGQVPPSAIITAFNKLNRGICDVCKGRRMVRNDSFQRGFLSSIFNFLFRLLFLTSVSDINAKPKLIKREFLNNLNLVSDDWFIDAEAIIKLNRLNAKFDWVPLDFAKRENGKSNVKSITVFEFLKNMFKFRLGLR